MNFRISLLILVGIIFVIAIGCEDELSNNTRTWPPDELIKESHFIEPSTDTDEQKILYLTGDDYRMGYQHGYWLKQELTEVATFLDTDIVWKAAITLIDIPRSEFDDQSLKELAYNITYDTVMDHCEGIADGSDGAFSVDLCVEMNSVCWILEHLYAIIGGQPPMCSGFVAANEATEGGDLAGKLIHGRNLDWDAMDFILDYPILFVHKPDKGFSYVNMGWPGQVAVLTGMNEHGISVENNENMTENNKNITGRSHLQMFLKVLREASTIDEAIAILNSEPHGTGEICLLSDGKTREAAAIEMNGNRIAIRRMDAEGNVTDHSGNDLGYDNVIWITNHFEDSTIFSEQSRTTDLNDMQDNSVARYTRLQERLTGTSRAGYTAPATYEEGFAYGNIDLEEAAYILRDPKDMRTRTNLPCTEYLTNHSVGNNHNVQSFLFVPEDLHMYVAAGWDDECGQNVLYNPYIGYDLNELFNGQHTGSLGYIDPDYKSYEP